MSGVFLYSTSPIYGMDTDGEQKKHQHLKARVKGKGSQSTISSLSALEHRIKNRNKLEDLGPALWQLFQFFGDSFNNPLLVGPNKGEIWKKSVGQGHLSFLYNIGWLARKKLDKDSPEEFKKRFKEIFTKNQYDWPLELSESFYWWKRAQATNDAEAQCAIGTHYCTGKGVEKDYEKGRFWLEKAAKQNHSVAQENMGILCRETVQVLLCALLEACSLP